MAIINCIVTKILLKENLVMSGPTVFFRLSTALDEDILNAGIMLNKTLNKRIDTRDTIIKPGEYISF